MTSLDDIKAAIARLDPADRARLKAWLDASAGSPGEAKPDPMVQAAKYGRLAGKAFANLRKGLQSKP